ncbi:MAG TPA: hypothetical protein VIL37_06620 [Natronosporangium sp.]
MQFRVGDRVRVRSAAEIFATLDQNGERGSLPFMPEMLQFCGSEFTVHKVAHKLCDTISGSGFRKLEDAVHLAGVRCDGLAHGGCQAGCLLYWKTDWLEPVDADNASSPLVEPEPPPARMLQVLTAATRGPLAPEGEETYRCQSTELLRAAPEPLPVRNLGQYIQDVRTGNAGIGWTIRAFLVALFNRFQDISRQRLPRWLRFRGGMRWGFLRGKATTRTPTARTDLKPGELVRVKPKREILKTLNANLLNRGLGFDVEMTRFCGRTARVERRVEKIIDEKTGRMLHMRNPCIVLEGVVCEGAYSVNCPRSIYAYWRELWLERVEEG